MSRPSDSLNSSEPERPAPLPRYMPGTAVPPDQCASCHFISGVVPVGLGLASYWYFILHWEAQARQSPPPKIRIPYPVKKGMLAAGSFGMVGYGVYRLFWKEPGTPGLF